MKRKTTLLVSGFVTAGCLLLYGLSALGLENESQVLKTFRVHQETFEELRRMMLSEDSLELVGDSWVVVGHKEIHRGAPDFPTDKYAKYHALLQHAHARAIRRNIDSPQEINFLLDRAGFAGDSIHTGVCWRDVSPGYLVSSFKSYLRSSQITDRRQIYVHIEGNWYLWRD